MVELNYRFLWKATNFSWQLIHTTKLIVDLLRNLIDMFMKYLCVHHVVK